MAKYARFIKCLFSPNNDQCGQCNLHQQSSHDHLADNDSVDVTTMKMKQSSWKMCSKMMMSMMAVCSPTMQQEMTSSCALEANMRLKVG